MAETVAHPLVIEAARLLRERRETISFAESCTGGLLSAIFTRMPGVSDVFDGSIVAYAYPVKESQLGVPKELLMELGAVSLPVARAMAVGVRSRLSTTWGVSITGVAGPGGGSAAKPVGTVCFGLAGPNVDEVIQHKFTGTRRQIQMKSALFALKLLLRQLGSDLGTVRGERISKKKSKKG